VVNIVTGGDATGVALVAHPGIDMVAFTGSSAVGRKIAAACGASLKRVTLELGGKSAGIVLEDADLDLFAATLGSCSVPYSGQSCHASTRILAPAARHDEVVDTVASALAAMPVGDPLDPSTVIGPLVSAAQRDRVEGYIELGKSEGAKLALGGGRPKGIDRGYYVEPTVFSGVRSDMRVAREEIFGPVRDRQHRRQLCRDGTERPLRRRQEQRHRPRKRPGGLQGVHDDQVDSAPGLRSPMHRAPRQW
jgi:aldehyde dehydrogenase (NAD+)